LAGGSLRLDLALDTMVAVPMMAVAIQAVIPMDLSMPGRDTNAAAQATPTTVNPATKVLEKSGV